MQRITLLISAGALAVWGVANALGGCGGDAASPDTTTPDGATPNDGNNPGTSPSGSSDAIAPDSDGGDLDAPSETPGEVTSNPGKVTCGTTACDGGNLRTKSACCLRDAGADPVCTTVPECSTDDIELRCDEPSDCPKVGTSRQGCCLNLFGAFGNKASVCGLGCGSGVGPYANDIPLCKTDVDCGDGGTSQPTCGLKKCGDYHFHVCGSPKGCQ